MKVDYGGTWYHGSPLQLEVLREGSTITQWRDLARVFSHKPTIVSVSDDRQIQHNGELPGYLYEIAEPVGPADVRPHPRTTMAPGDEWLTRRPLELHLIGETVVRPEEYLSEDDIADLRARQEKA
ncbi:MAG: hypothetical protein ACP5HS_08335 [Anaerolineae bacterium]